MTKRLQSRDAQLKKLRETVKRLSKEIKEKDRLLLSYERDWALKLFDDLQTILNEYSILLIPPPLIVKGSYKNQGYSFQVEVGQIVGLFSEARTKAILLTKPIPNIGSNEIVTDVIYTEMGFPELSNQLDRGGLHFCQINRSCYVNLRHYNLVNNEVATNKIENSLFDKYSHIEVSKRHVADFIAKKNAYHHISSLQKDQLHYILNFIINGLNSFTKKLNNVKSN